MDKRVFWRVLLWLLVVFMLSGVNYCQKSYSIGAQTSGTETPTATPDDDDLDDDDDLITPTPTAESGTSTPTPTPTEEGATPTPEPTVGIASALLHDLTDLRGGNQTEESTQPKAKNNNSRGGVKILGEVSLRAPAKRTAPENWLGTSYSGEESSRLRDQDGDGYSTALEEDWGSDPFDASSVPPALVTELRMRMLGQDDDVDGVSNDEERQLGTMVLVDDSDQDGVKDGAEVLSGSDPLDGTLRPFDSDGDGLSDAFEEQEGTNRNSADTDGDRLRDDVEFFVGSNPLEPDSDFDGVLDGREVLEGADPIIPEYNG